jgi:DNA-binding transcriptional regulator YiaG
VKLKLNNPTRQDLKDLRSCYHLTQTEAAVLALSSLRTWQYWERGEHVMHRAIWQYLQIVARALARRRTEAKPQSLSTFGDI